MKIRRFSLALLFGALVLPLAASAQEASLYRESNGGVLNLNIGPAFSPIETVSSGYQKFTTTAAGLSAGIDVGYHWKFFALTFNFMIRTGWALENTQYKHCPGGAFSGQCFTYNAIERSEWDGYFLGLGILADFFIPITEKTFFTTGLGFDVPIGIAMDREHAQAQFSFKLRFSIQHFISSHFAIGAAIKISTLIVDSSTFWGDILYEDRSSKGVNFNLDPALTMTYLF